MIRAAGGDGVDPPAKPVRTKALIEEGTMVNREVVARHV
jgi:hypothetical protein